MEISNNYSTAKVWNTSNKMFLNLLKKQMEINGFFKREDC